MNGRDPRWRFLLTFVLVMAVELGAVVLLFERNLDLPLNRATARAAAAVLSLLLSGCTAQGDVVSCASLSSVRIIFECTGAFPVGIFLGAVLAFPSGWRRKAMGTLLGVPAILAVNLVRVMSLVWLGYRFPLWTEWLHVVLWQTLMIVFVVLLWLAWASAARPGMRKRLA